MTHQPIRRGGSGPFLLRRRLNLEGPCRGGRLKAAANAPVQLYVDGLRAAGAPGGALAERPLWQPLVLEGVLEAGLHELTAVVGAPPDGAPPWFACDGRLEPAAGGPPQPVESDLRWQAAPLPPDAGEGFSALDHVPAEEDWAGVETAPGIEVAGEAPRAEERLLAAERFAAFEETFAAGALSFAPASSGAGRCKCVRREGLLALSGGTSVLTGGERAIAFVLDFGRIVTGCPCLRLREGRGGLIEVGAAAAWGRVDRELRYVCGSGRQEWYGLTPVRCRYLVVRLSGFEEEVAIERLALCERFVPAGGEGGLSFTAGHDRAWAAGAPSLQGSRLDAYLIEPPPAACDWWGARALLLADAARTGHLAAGRATLLGRAPDPDRPRPEDRPFPLCLEAYHDCSGDSDTLERLLPAALEAALREPESGAASLATAIAAAAAAARLCAWAGLDSGAGPCEEAAAAAGSRLEALWRPERGLYADAAEGGFSQLANGLVLAAGAAPGDRAGPIAAALRGPGVAPVADLSGAVLLAEGLWRSGQGARALEVIDTWWLRIAGREGPAWRDKRGAEASALAPGPDYLLGRFLLGVSPSEPGFASRRVEPALSLAERAGGRLPTPAGDLSVEWRTEGADGERRTAVRLEAAGPGETALVLDRGGRPRPELSVDGEAVWRNEKLYPNASVRGIAADPGAVTLLFQGPGAWEVILQ